MLSDTPTKISVTLFLEFRNIWIKNIRVFNKRDLFIYYHYLSSRVISPLVYVINTSVHFLREPVVFGWASSQTTDLTFPFGPYCSVNFK